MAENVSTTRTAVKTYVPSYQKDNWQAHADRLDMSQSEFVRTMVQAGRRHFDEDHSAKSEPPASADTTDDKPSETDLRSRVREQLSGVDALTWDELVAALTDDVEARLEDALDELQAENEVKYSGRDGGYTLIES